MSETVIHIPSLAPFRRRVIAGVIFGLTTLAAQVQAASPVWRCGWYAQPPLQFAGPPGAADNLTGLDVEVVRAVTQAAGWRVQFDELRWDRQQEELRSGAREMAFGAIWTPEGETFARFSEPYRRTENSLYLRTGELDRHRFTDVAAFLALVRAKQLRLGIVKGRPPVLAEVRAFVTDPANAAHVVASDTDTQNLTALAIGEIDAALTDRFVAATLTSQLGYDTRVAEHAARFGSADVRVMFSRAATTEADLANFNRALRAVQATEAFDHILHSNLLPPLFDIAIGGRWFHWLDLLGTAAFALSGVILAHQGRYNLVGAFVLSALPAVGGGVLRDLVIGRRPVGVLLSPTPLLMVAGLVIAGYVFFQLWDRAAVERRKHPGKIAGVFAGLCSFFDTVGLAAFTVTGVNAAVEAHCDPLPLWGPVLAVLTGAGGGVLRDIVRADFHNPTLKRGFYAEVALVWALALSFFLELQVRRAGVDEVRQGTLLVLVGAFATRLLILNRGWENPLQFGSRHTRPARRLAALLAESESVGAAFSAWFEERNGVTQPLASVEIEKLHSATLHRLASLRDGGRELELTQPPPEVAARAAALRRELDCLAAAETALYELVHEPAFSAEPARRLQEAIFTSAATLCQAMADGAHSAEDRAMFLELTHTRGSALEEVRARFTAAADRIATAERERILQVTVRFERFVRLLREACETRAEVSPAWRPQPVAHGVLHA